MDIATQVEIVLRDEGYETWTWTAVSPAVTCFENAAIIGFVHVFRSTEELLEQWLLAQQTVLSRHSAALRAAGGKAWNVYSVFLAQEHTPTLQRDVERIEEDFSLTRKIARAGVRTLGDVQNALLPLTAVKASPVLSDADFRDRLGIRLGDVSGEVLAAFFGDVGAEDVARILVEGS